VSADLPFFITALLIYIAFKLREMQQGLAANVRQPDQTTDYLDELKKIREEICCEFEKSPSGSGLKLTKWGLKGIGEGIRSDLKKILEEIRLAK
jgi:hypothetical protein